MNPTSNITVVSNVFPVSREYVTPERVDPHTRRTFRSGGVCKDPRFRKHIYGREALRKLARELGITGNDERQIVKRMKEDGLIERWQIEVFFKQVLDGGCGCPNVGKTVGIIYRNGRIEVVCRCPNGPRCRVPQSVDMLSLPTHP
jgi:hypothetical protein